MLSMELPAVAMSLSAIVKILFISFFSACLMYCIDIGKLEGMLLEKYAKWLNNGNAKYKKLIGGCGVCTSFWIGAILCAIFLPKYVFFVPFITVYIYQKL